MAFALAVFAFLKIVVLSGWGLVAAAMETIKKLEEHSATWLRAEHWAIKWLRVFVRHTKKIHLRWIALGCLFCAAFLAWNEQQTKAKDQAGTLAADKVVERSDKERIERLRDLLAREQTKAQIPVPATRFELSSPSWISFHTRSDGRFDGVYLETAILNRGAPSVATNWKLEIYPPDGTMPHTTNGDISVEVLPDPRSTSVKPSQHLAADTALHPISSSEPVRRGFLYFDITLTPPPPLRLNSPETIFIISAYDASGIKFSAEAIHYRDIPK